ncbi:hypothetical protein BDQ12DRAFT_645494 [Crucibulum laeve]|uniref:F-box domain-containing protein n=1 Tax=Crucibulum laeve TaxID=68775 RepID=A0A5C3MBB4_9AGAR|nr:hypothetical protein BDQ12DRAFT_645494 [Crucibulum laeve]
MEAKSSSAPPRKSSRIRKKIKSTVDEEDHNGRSDTEFTPAVKQRKPHALGKRKAGKLSGLLELPLDVLFEIFAHLHPADLLKMARLNKEFRKLLMHRSTIGLWKDALANVSGLPECPAAMTEIEWVNLVFSQHCHYCLSTVRTVEWTFRKRICTTCARDQLVEYNRYMYMISDPDFILAVPTRTGKKQTNYYLAEHYNAVEKEYHALETDEARAEYLKQKKAEAKDIMNHAKLCERWFQSQQMSRSDELQKLREERKAAIVKKLRDLGWGKDLDSIGRFDPRLDYLKAVKQPHRLTERVWMNIKDSVLEFMASVRQRRLQKEYKELIIARKSSAVHVFREYKNALLPMTEPIPEPPNYCAFTVIKDILNQAADVEVSEHSYADVIPLIPDLIDIWRKDIHSKLIETMQFHSVRRQSGNSLRYPFMDEDYGYDVDSDLEDRFFFDSDEEEEYQMQILLRREMSTPTAESRQQLEKKLALATTVFSCSHCDNPSINVFGFVLPLGNNCASDKPLFYPNILGLSCCTRAETYYGGPLSTDSTIRLENQIGEERRPWSCSKISIHDTFTALAGLLIKKAGLDPETATPEDMDNLGLRFACLYCKEELDDETRKEVEAEGHEIIANTRLLHVYEWREMINHHREHLKYDKEPRVLKLPVDRLQEATFRKRTNEVYRDAQAANSIWSCVHCRDLASEIAPVTIDEMKEHLAEHEIMEPELNKDYYKEFGIFDFAPPTIAVLTVP